MNDEDKKRCYRNLQLSLYDLEKIVNSLNETKGFYFRNGVQDRYAEIEVLTTKLKLSILAEK